MMSLSKEEKEGTTTVVKGRLTELRRQGLPILGLGCSSFSHFFSPSSPDDLSWVTPTNPTIHSWITTILHAISHHNINLLDTAPWYGHGSSELIIGYAVDLFPSRGINRHDVIINTKIGRYSSDPGRMFDYSAEMATTSVASSIKRMRCDYIDVLQLHDPEFAPSVELLLDVTIPAMERLRKEENAVMALGVTGYPLEVQREILMRSRGELRIEFDQALTYCHYNLHDRLLFGDGYRRGGGGEDDDDEKQSPQSSSNNDDTQPTQQQRRRYIQIILHSLSNDLFRLITHHHSQIRETTLIVLHHLLLHSPPNANRRYIPYLLPIISSRYPPSSYDATIKIFVHDREGHEAYKRGMATERQDRWGLITSSSSSTTTTIVPIVESCEEARLLLIRILSTLLRQSSHSHSLPTLTSYLPDIIHNLQTNLYDPSSPDVLVEASRLLLQIVRMPEYWDGITKYYAVGLARAALPLMRRKWAAVRVGAIELFEGCVSVPDGEKVKGAGSEAILDLVGFREENVLPVGAFYSSQCSLSINLLAELIADKNTHVRFQCCSMLSYLIVCLPDRYDHQQRLLPYLLSFYHDSNPSLSSMALQAVANCGDQYEAEHPDDVVERRQYGVDGVVDHHYHHRPNNNNNVLPPPFETRPSLGSRLFIRGNTKRFFNALLNELTHWMGPTRIKSAKLLEILVVYCEEHLTMDCHATLPLLVKGLTLARENEGRKEEGSEEMRVTMEGILKLWGRFVDPGTYVPLVLPRIVGEFSSSTEFDGGSRDASRPLASSSLSYFSIESSPSIRSSYARALSCLIDGSRPSRLVSRARDIIRTLSSETCLGSYVATTVRRECLNVLVNIVRCFGGEKEVVVGRLVTDHFGRSGRLVDLKGCLEECGGVFERILEECSCFGDEEEKKEGWGDVREMRGLARDGLAFLSKMK